MRTSGKFRPTRQGFTLVELLAVIVIIGILAGFLLGAVTMSRLKVKNSVITAEIGQLDFALKRYKDEVGEYPPDFTGLNQDGNPAVTTPGESAAKLVLTRHLRKRFPRFIGFPNAAGVVVPGWDGAVLAIAANYGVDASRLDSASALAFWLDGLPEDPTLGNKPSGFHKDPINPFKTGLPRSKPYSDFSDKEDRYTYATANVLQCRYFPEGIPARENKPYVYFRPQRAPKGERTYWFVERNPVTPTEYLAMVRTWPPVVPSTVPAPASDRAVPYMDTRTPVIRWHAEDTYQIVCSGLDYEYGARAIPALQILPAVPPPALPITYPYPVSQGRANFTKEDGDNVTSVFAGKLEDMKE